MATDDLTLQWIRNEADERAVFLGARFDINRAAHAIWWIGRYCRLYEGSFAGEPLVLRGAYSQSLKANQETWSEGGKKWAVARIREYGECVLAGERCDWQLEVASRLFGWTMYSERWKCELRRFTRGSTFVSKKNKKSPTLAGIGLYLTCGDGEQGMKTFLCATNLDQAKDIAGQHAIEMVKASPELQAECEINVSKARITHGPTRSMMQPLSSGDTRSQRAKEGLNGSALVDEVHVVSREQMSRLVRMGISRKEPFILDFSTCGSDVDSYGYDQWVYGTKNNATGEDPHFFFQSYEAPQNISDTDLAANLERYIEMANPALGHTVDMNEAKQDYLTSRVDGNRLAEFKMYRLNIWQRTATPWISQTDWARSVTARQRSIKPNEPCWAGLNLGYTDEPSALTIVFPKDHAKIDEAIADKKSTADLIHALDQPMRSKTWYWLPRGAVEQWKHVLPYEEWEKTGQAKIHRGTIIDPMKILADISAIIAKYDVQAIAFDPWEASTIIAGLQESEGFPEERCWEFPQNSPKIWAFPCALLERLVVGGKLRRKANDAFDWEMGHATIKPDKLGGVSLVKPLRGDRKTVNGPASLIAALDAMARAPRFYRSELVVF